MLNQVVMVGRLVNDPIMSGNNTVITIAVPRSYKNENGEYDTDFIDVKLFKDIANNVIEYCKKGDLLGIKGRLETTENNNRRQTIVVAEKITFLSSKN